MRTILMIGFLLITVSAFAQSKKSITETQKLVYAFAELINNQDFTQIGEIVAEDYKQHNPMVEQGLEGLKQGVGWFLSVFPDLSCEVEEITIQSNIVAVRFKWSGTQKLEFMGISPSESKKHWKSADWWRVKDGKFVEHWDVVDWSALTQTQ